jgi:hypothetical protein
MTEKDFIGAKAIDEAEQSGARTLAILWLRKQPRTWSKLIVERTGWAQWLHRLGLVPYETSNEWKVSTDPRRRIATWESDDTPLDLSGASLAGFNLREADLRGADLSGANLKGADIREADLRGADLSGSNLKGADIRFTDLRGANISGANLKGADITGVILGKS